MKKLAFLLLISAVLLASCHSVFYKYPPPREVTAIDEVPTNMRGTYILEAFDNEDTVIVRDAGFTYDGEHVLNQNAVLKFMDGYYFLSMQQDTLDLWGNFLLQKLNDTAYAMFDLDAENEADRQAIQALTQVETFLNEEGEVDYIVIDPKVATIREWLKLGLYKQVGILRKVPEN